MDIIEMGRGYIGVIIMTILMATGVVSGMYAGECMEVDLSELENCEDVLYMVVGNSSNIDGMNVSLNTDTKNASVCFVINYKPDNFTLVFLDNQTNEVIKEIHHYSGGSSGSTTYIDKNISQNKTIYVPEYINNTEIVEVEKIVYEVEVVEDDGVNVWQFVLLSLAACVLTWFVVWIIRD